MKKCFMSMRVEVDGAVQARHLLSEPVSVATYESEFVFREVCEALSEEYDCACAVVSRDEIWDWQQDDDGDGPLYWWVGTLHAELSLYRPGEAQTRVSVELQQVRMK